MRRAFLKLGLLAALTVALVVISLKYIFVVREIVVSGNDGIDAELVISASGLEPGMGMLRLNTETVKNGISTLGTHTLGEMEYMWPDGVCLSLQARVRTAMALSGESVAVLDSDCIVMELEPEVPGRDLVYISGADVEQACIGQALMMDDGRMETCRALLKAIDACGAGAHISEIDLSNPEEAVLVLRNGCAAAVETEGDLHRQIEWAKAIAQDMERRGEAGGMLHITHGGHADLVPAQNMAK